MTIICLVMHYFIFLLVSFSGVDIGCIRCMPKEQFTSSFVFILKALFQEALLVCNRWHYISPHSFPLKEAGLFDLSW